jgi:hypothetical protein
MWGWTSVERTWQDLRYAVRSLRNTPGFTIAAVLSLALGIGANTAIFSLLNAVVLRLLPVPDPHQLVHITYTTPGPAPNNWNSWFGFPQFERFRDQTKTLSGVFGGTGIGRLNVGYRGTAGLAQGDAYTDIFFTVLGLIPQHGRFFASGEDRADATAVILSHRYWRSRFGADPRIVGETVTLNQMPFTVIGITPPEFSGIFVGTGPDVWVPLRTLERFRPERISWTASFNGWMLIAARLRPEFPRRSPGRGGCDLPAVEPVQFSTPSCVAGTTCRDLSGKTASCSARQPPGCSVDCATVTRCLSNCLCGSPGLSCW